MLLKGGGGPFLVVNLDVELVVEPWSFPLLELLESFEDLVLGLGDFVL